MPSEIPRSKSKFPESGDGGEPARVEWVRPSDLRRLFGISRSLAYELMAERTIRSVLLRKRGNVSGVRLVEADSVRRYLLSLIVNNE